ncbi:Lar family restriction alleviation protein [Pseudomonas fluorescens]
MTTNQTIDGVPRELKPCPFCGSPAKLAVEEVRGDDAWCFIRCSWRCKAAPYVGESSCVWYWSEGKRHRHQSDEKAKDQARENAVRAWNTRHEPAAQPQGEPVYQVQYNGGYAGWRDVDAGTYTELKDDKRYISRIVYAEQPAPVAAAIQGSAYTLSQTMIKNCQITCCGSALCNCTINLKA